MQRNLLRLPIKRAGEPVGVLSQLLVSGSDTRLHLNERTNLNGHGCRPIPRPFECSLSSSTASTISERAYSAVEAAFQTLNDSNSDGGLEHALEELAEKTRQDIKTCLELGHAGIEVLPSPSGTDSELHALYVANCVLEKPIASVIVAADETGSGVSHAASGRHFDAVTSGGRPVVKGDPIAGLATGAMSVPVNVRDGTGRPLAIAAVDENVRRCVAKAVASGSCVVLHVMDHSKTGGRYASPDCIGDIVSTFGSSVQVVVDACQTRLSRVRLRRYLDLGYMVLVTGSKFFTGPPLSGALLVPAPLSMRMMEVSKVPPGLTDYTTRYDWPKTWRFIRSQLPKRTPLGQLLRWIAALEEMRAYFAVPEFVRKLVLREFAATISRSIDRYPYLELVPVDSAGIAGTDDDDEFDVRTIYPLLVRRSAPPLSLAQSRTLYRALNEDVSELFPKQGTPAERELAARLCHIGQPVAIADRAGRSAGAIRISADARLVYECWSDADKTIAVEKMRRRFGEVHTILDKLDLLVRNFDEIDRAYGAR